MDTKVEVLPSEGYLTESETADGGISQYRAQMLIEMGLENGLDDATIMKKLQDKIGLSSDQASEYLKKYGKMCV